MTKLLQHQRRIEFVLEAYAGVLNTTVVDAVNDALYNVRSVSPDVPQMSTGVASRRKAARLADGSGYTDWHTVDIIYSPVDPDKAADEVESALNAAIQDPEGALAKVGVVNLRLSETGGRVGVSN
jgi:hypothetical protein